MGWTRKGRKGSFRYFDQRGRQIRDPEKIERIERLAWLNSVVLETSSRRYSRPAAIFPPGAAKSFCQLA